MKDTDPTKALGPPKRIRALSPENAKPALLDPDALNMSRERIMEGVITTTAVLSEILEKANRPQSMRYWGINE